uniref:CC domain-containing protein n=1 Tax=Acrobeloides nanus TaxID=290746 RepID=A0A914EHW6_9BILA
MHYSGVIAISLLVIVVCADAFKYEGLAVGPCINGKCQPGFACRNGECYPKNEKAAASIKRVQSDAVGPCINGACPPGHFCDNGQCRPSRG